MFSQTPKAPVPPNPQPVQCPLEQTVLKAAVYVETIQSVVESCRQKIQCSEVENSSAVSCAAGPVVVNRGAIDFENSVVFDTTTATTFNTIRLAPPPDCDVFERYFRSFVDVENANLQASIDCLRSPARQGLYASSCDAQAARAAWTQAVFCFCRISSASEP